MEIAIIGTGNVGGALARHWHTAGHRLRLGARDRSDGKAQALAQEVGAQVSGVEDSVRDADIVALAIPGKVLLETVAQLAGVLAGKIVVVPANDMSRSSPNLAQAVAQAAPGAGVIRAFNTIAAETLAAGSVDGDPVDMFYVASEDADEAARRLISDCGLRPIRVGDVDKGDLIDSLFALWVALVFEGGRGRSTAFALKGE